MFMCVYTYIIYIYIDYLYLYVFLVDRGLIIIGDVLGLLSGFGMCSLCQLHLLAAGGLNQKNIPPPA